VLATVSVLGIERVKGEPNALVGLAMKEGTGEPVVRRLRRHTHHRAGTSGHSR
jgi:hypothetical protein